MSISKKPLVPSGTSGFSKLTKPLHKVLLFLVVVLVSVPLFPLFSSWFSIETQLWQHLWQTQLPTLLANTFLLVVLVGGGSFALGVGLAWIVVMYEFRGRKILQWGLMLPLAIPPYIFSFVVLGFTDYGGPLQSLLNLMGLGPTWLPDIRNVIGVSLVFILALYPYVYLLMRAALLRKGRASYESARTLGYSKQAAFWRLVIPLTRPAWITGLALVLMETLADFGAVSIFNFDTFTTAIYKSWFGLFSLNTAAQLASILLLFVSLAVMAEKWGRGQSQYVQTGNAMAQFRQPLTGVLGFWIQIIAWVIFAIGFLLPIIQLLYWVIETYQDATAGTMSLLWRTFELALIGTVLTIFVAGILVWSQRQAIQHDKLLNSKTSRWRPFFREVSLLGYALPGTVLAVGIVIGFNYLDSLIANITNNSQQWLAGGLFALLFAYVVRFLRIGYGPLASSLEQIKPTIVEAAASLGADKKERVFRVYIPLLSPGIFSAALLVFVEVMKEMPATLLLRPFGWDTLAVRIYELTSEGEWQLAALPAVLLVAVGVVPVIYLMKKSEQ